MYWDIKRQLWNFVASTCGSAYSDTFVSAGNGFVNISTYLCDPYNPVPPTCPNETISCQTSGNLAPVNSSCVFPFTYKGVRHSGCTTVDSPTGQPWCATKATWSDGAWGFCNCAGGRCVTQGAMAPQGTPCKFPFTANGVRYSSCLSNGIGFNSICATGESLADGDWGFCSCFNISYEKTGCVPAGRNGENHTDTNASLGVVSNGTNSSGFSQRLGPTGPVQLALMLVSSVSACAAPYMNGQVLGPFPQGYSLPVPVFLNYTSKFDDEASFVVVGQPQYGTLDSELLSQGVIKYRIADNQQFFFGNDTFFVIAQQTGFTSSGVLSPCAPLRSAVVRITIQVNNIRDAPILTLDLNMQPDKRLLQAYGNDTRPRFAFDVNLTEDEPFSIIMTIQDHDARKDFDFRLLITPKQTSTPAWVLPYAPPFRNATVTTLQGDMQTWAEFGTAGQLRITYVPSQHLHGLDSLSFTVYDHAPDGSTALPASTAPFEFRFHIKPVNNPPVALGQSITLDGKTGSQKSGSYLGRLRYYDVESPHSNLSISLSSAMGYFNVTLYFMSRKLGPVANSTTNCSLQDANCPGLNTTDDLDLGPQTDILNLERRDIASTSNDSNTTATTTDAYNYQFRTLHGTVTLLPPSFEPAADESSNAVMFLYEPDGGVSAAKDSFTFEVFDGSQRSLGVVEFLFPSTATFGGNFPVDLLVAIILVLDCSAAVVILYILYPDFFKSKSGRVSPPSGKTTTDKVSRSSSIAWSPDSAGRGKRASTMSLEPAHQTILREAAQNDESRKSVSLPGATTEDAQPDLTENNAQPLQRWNTQMENNMIDSVQELMSVFPSPPEAAPTVSPVFSQPKFHTGPANVVPSRVTAHAKSVRGNTNFTRISVDFEKPTAVAATNQLFEAGPSSPTNPRGESYLSSLFSRATSPDPRGEDSRSARTSIVSFFGDSDKVADNADGTTGKNNGDTAKAGKPLKHTQSSARLRRVSTPHVIAVAATSETLIESNEETASCQRDDEKTVKESDV